MFVSRKLKKKIDQSSELSDKVLHLFYPKEFELKSFTKRIIGKLLFELKGFTQRIIGKLSFELKGFT